MNDMYQRIQLAGEKKDSEEIIAILAAIKAGRLKNDLMLLNYFREIPVSYGASVESVEEGFAELKVNQIQAVVISFEKVTVLKSSHFQRDVISNVNYVNIEKSIIMLSSFYYALVRADRRMSVRVELAEPIYASFCYEGGTVKGKLHDMSLTGVSFNVTKDPGIPLSEKGELDVSLPSVITVPASLLKIIPVEDGFRLVFEIEASRSSELNISQYIFRRQLEIIKELKDHPRVG
jgi:hypothetical protein